MGELSSGAEPADWSNIAPKQRITHQWSDTARGEKRFPVRDVLTNHNGSEPLLVMAVGVPRNDSPPVPAGVRGAGGRTEHESFYFPNTLSIWPSFFSTFPVVFSALPSASRSGLFVTLPAVSLTLPFT